MRVVRGLRAEGVATTRQTSGGPISVEPRINDRIRIPEVRLVGPNGEQVGIVAIGDALRLAQEADLDLVEVAVLGELEGLADGDDADLLTVGTDQAHLRHADPVVDAGFSADGASW